MKKNPPIAKVYEAYSAIADNRIILGDGEATVTSSDGAKTYKIKWNGDDYSSNDNASYWQGYPGYPIVAVLMLQDKLNYNKKIIPFFKGINWHELNEKYKRDYDKAIEEVLDGLSIDKDSIIKDTEKTYEELINMTINVKKKI